MIGQMDTELIRDFYAVSYSAGMNLHIKLLNGLNNHHIAEAAFKAFAKALDMASGFDKKLLVFYPQRRYLTIKLREVL